MHLICPICSHSWQERVSPGTKIVICPECVGEIPVADASQATTVGRAPASLAEQETQILPTLTEQTGPAQATDHGEQKTRAIGGGLHSAETILLGGHDTTAHGDGHDGQTLKQPPEEIPRQKARPGPIDDASAETRRLSSFNETRETAPVAPPARESEPRERKGRDDIKKQYAELIGRTLDGYRIEKLLGAGGMGAVYLAHQISLDRKVALKVLPAHLANNFDLVARFTREALSAAQLNHHNVTQVYDVGTCDGIQYFVMELVRGESLGQIIRRDGPLRVDDAAGYVLQTARGLHYAHERGIIHRDIKPDNLMVNEHGIVKIADMGLAKMRGTIEERYEFDPNEASKFSAATNVDLTMSNMALGTPAYMAPEQARDTSTVDSRADQYSLGCTLYYLCAGKAPYSGTTAFELMSKHLKEPLIPIETHVRGVPPAFSEIIRKMLAKNPDERYATLKDAGKALEQYLGVDSDTGPYKPREHHLAVLEDCQKGFYAARARKHRRLALVAFFILIPILIVSAFLAKSFVLVGAALAVAMLVPLASIVINGISNRTYLYRRLRGVVFGMGWKGWLKTVLVAVAIVAFLVLTGWIWSWLAVLVAAAAISAAYQALILRPLRLQREPTVERMNEMLKELRLRGLPEEALQDFVCRFAGADWQEFFEQFFTYEDMLLARARTASADKVKARHKWATWRDPIFRAFDRVDDARRQRREKVTLTRAEKDRLKAEGLDEAKASEMAEMEATRILKSGLVLTPPKEDHKVVTRRKLKLGGPLKVGYRVLRFAGGAAMLAAAVIVIISKFGIAVRVPEQVEGMLKSYYSLGFGGNMHGLIGFVAGLALLVSAFSSRLILPTFVLLGALLLAFAGPIIRIVNQPQFNSLTLLWTAAGLVVVGAGLPLLKKISGGKF